MVLTAHAFSIVASNEVMEQHVFLVLGMMIIVLFGVIAY